MKVLYCGFNLYEQFNKSTLSVVENFREGVYTNCIDIIFSHTFSLVINEKSEVIYNGNKHGIFIIPPDLRIKQLVCTDKIVVLLAEDGLLFRLDVKEFTVKPLLEHFSSKFLKIACGSKITVALTQEGEVYNLPNKLNFVNKDIVDLQAGCEHCLLLSLQGDVYSFGCGSRGQLGHGDLETHEEPQLIKALAGIKITKIATGGWHSCAVSSEGDLYTWGWNSNGQLAVYSDELSTVSVYALPQVIDICEEMEHVIDVACGNRHTVVLLGNGKLWGSGWNKYHQLGSISEVEMENIHQMNFLGDFSHLISDITNIKLKCGPWCTAFIIY